jgi:protein-tyrosine-phosphatase
VSKKDGVGIMRTVLFVCTANIARSPMAEAMFNELVRSRGLAGKYQARSAGTWARAGLSAPSDGQQVMKSLGLDTSSHLSQVITEPMIMNADLILTMEEGHKEALQIEFPKQKEKIYMLSEMIDKRVDIDDPYMRGIEKYQETVKELMDLIEAGFSRIITLIEED